MSRLGRGRRGRGRRGRGGEEEEGEDGFGFLSGDWIGKNDKRYLRKEGKEKIKKRN